MEPIDKIISDLDPDGSTRKKRKRLDSRRKGNCFELRCVELLNRWAKGVWLFRRSHDKECEKTTGDIVPLNPKRYFPLHIEARKNESWTFENMVSQGSESILVYWFVEKERAKKTLNPVIFMIAQNRRGPYAMMRRETFNVLCTRFGDPTTAKLKILEFTDPDPVPNSDLPCRFVFLRAEQWLDWIDPEGLVPELFTNPRG